MAVSVIIPTLDEAERIGGLIEILHLQGFEEIIVADGGSCDDTRKIALNAGANVLHTPRGRGGQLQKGAASARCEHLFFLHADSTPPPLARSVIADSLSAPDIVAGSFRLAFDHKHPILRFYALMSRINHDLFTFGDQGFFIASDAYRRIGGFSDTPIFEDNDIVRRARKAGRFVKRPEPITTSARRFVADGIVRRQLANAFLLGLYRLGISPHHLARWYRPDRKSRKPAA